MALTAAQLQEFETQKAAFYKQYSINRNIEAAIDQTAPVKARFAPAVDHPLDVRAKSSASNAPCGVFHRAKREVSPPRVSRGHGGVVYDRKSSQDNMHRFHSSDLMQQSNKYAEYLQYSTQLKKYNIPTDVQLVDKKDLPAFKTMYSVTGVLFSQYLEKFAQRIPQFST